MDNLQESYCGFNQAIKQYLSYYYMNNVIQLRESVTILCEVPQVKTKTMNCDKLGLMVVIVGLTLKCWT